MPTTRQTCPCCQESFAVTALRRDGQVSCPSCGRIFPRQSAAPPSRWYYARDAQKYGPFPLEELRRRAATGLLRRTDMVLEEASTKWLAADSIPLLFSTVSVPDQPLSPIQQPVQPSSSPPSLPASQSSPLGNSRSPAPGLGRRLLTEILATCQEPILRTAHLLRYAQLRWRLRALRREDRAARLALGQRLYEAGTGDPALRTRVPALDEEIARLELAKGSTQAARVQRDQVILQIAKQALARPAPLQGTETAHDRVRRAGHALEDQLRQTAGVGRKLTPAGAGPWCRMLVGFALAVLLLLGFLLRSGREVITSLEQEKELAQSVGWVICGGKITQPNGRELEVATGMGSCFAITADGYLLTNKHVVEDTWAERHVPARKQAREAEARQLGISAEPMVWVFFGKEKYVGRIVHVSPEYDLAVLKIERRHVPFFRLSTGDSPSRGTKVVACGFPAVTRDPLTQGEALEKTFREERIRLAVATGKRVRVEDNFGPSAFEFDMTTGSVSRPVTEENGCKWIQHDATIHAGNSGGPLIMGDGTVVGINTLKHKAAAGVQLSLSLPQLRQEIDQQVPGVIWK